MESDPAKRAAQLEDGLREAQREGRRLGRRLEALDRKTTSRAALIEALESQVERTATSRSFRYGHGALQRFSRWVLRRPARASGLDTAAELLAEARLGLRAPQPVNATEARALRTPDPADASGRKAPRTPVDPTRSKGRPKARRRDSNAAAERERAMREGFRARYEALFQAGGTAGLDESELALPLPRDRRGMLLGGAADSEPEHPGADVVVCVRDAPEDVRACLWSLMHGATRPFHLIVVDDGSEPETAAMLDELARREPEIELLRNEGPEHGYTRAANIGLRASTGAHVVLLNSDTVVSPGWLERIVTCAESEEDIGVVGPLSNAATHQSLPAVKASDGWAVNELAPWLTVDSMAMLVAGLSDRERPRLPFLNGFCYAIAREALERVGLFDEVRFGSGYCEENDFSVRAQDAGFSLAVADDAYVFHSKSRSYTKAGRDEVARRNYQLFLDKHGAERVDRMLAELGEGAALSGLREAVAAAVGEEEATIATFRAANADPLSVLFVLHGMSEGSGGGVHSIYQEATGLRRLGAPATIAIAAGGMEHARVAYQGAEDVFVPYEDELELARLAEAADVVVATHHTTVGLVSRLHERYGGFRPAYYVQDYEPFFAEPGSTQLVEALDSYTAIPDQLVFAKTHWLRNLIGQLHGVDVAKVEPSLDTSVYSAEGRQERGDGPLRIAAMLRPRTPRRQPVLTLDALSALVAEHGDGVQVTTFGCPVGAAEALGRELPGPHLGLLSRHEVADLLKRTDVFLDASTYQAFGRTALEAMACGCTAVAPRIGGAAQFVRDGENGFLVDTFSPAPAVAAIGRLVEDEDQLRELQSAAVEEANRHSILRAALSEHALFARER